MPNTLPDPNTLPAGTLSEDNTLRIEADSLGHIAVPANHLWGAETQRSLQHFNIAGERMPLELPHAYAIVKKAAAFTNRDLGRLDPEKASLIAEICDEILAGQLDDEFPLFVWQTGSGTQSHMNVNEVIANRAAQRTGKPLGTHQPLDPKKHINQSQSTNDTFPTAMHIAAAFVLHRRVLPEIEALIATLDRKSGEWQDVLKVGRTHLQDAVPLTVGQEWSGYAAQLRSALAFLRTTLPGLHQLATGGTAVGTGLNAPRDFGLTIARHIAQLTGLPFTSAPNKFAALASLDAMVAAHAGLRQLAVALFKIANDMRWLASGPRCGLGELHLPENEPGSSIMPGKVNSTQSEALVMICTQVFGNDSAVAFAGAQGNFELNVMRPVILRNFLHSAQILADGTEKFRIYQVEGTTLNHERLQQDLDRNLMQVTALSPAIGYERSAEIAQKALAENLTLREAALATKLVDADTFDRLTSPEALISQP